MHKTSNPSKKLQGMLSLKTIRSLLVYRCYLNSTYDIEKKLLICNNKFIFQNLEKNIAFIPFVVYSHFQGHLKITNIYNHRFNIEYNFWDMPIVDLELLR
jgi:hypothetical protein